MDDKLEQRRHSAAHVLAMAVLRLFPDAKLGVGPVTREGYYHDIETPHRLRWEDIKRVEAEMNLIIEENLTFKQFHTSVEEGFQLLLSRGQIYKSELLQQISDSRVSFFQTGDEFVDLCRGPHMSSTGEIGAIKLLSVSDVHWKNDTSRPAMQRISGVAFAAANELNDYLTKLETIQSRDFIKQAQDMEMLVPDQKIIYTPAGSMAIGAIVAKIEQNLHKQNFEQLLSFENSDQQLITENFHRSYKLKNRSYRNLPLRMYSINHMQPHAAKDIHGKKLTNYVMLSAVSYTTPETLLNEASLFADMLYKLTEDLDIKAEAVIHAADLNLELVKSQSLKWKELGVSQTQIIDATVPDDGLALKLITRDSLDREWTLLTLTMRRSTTEYVDSDGEFKPNFEIELRVIIERIFAYYLEENEGDLPYWACPVQICIIPISEAQHKFAQQVLTQLQDAGLRTELNSRPETMQARIREAELNKVPLIIVVGEKEENADAVSVRLRDKQEVGLIGRQDLENTLFNYLVQT